MTDDRDSQGGQGDTVPPWLWGEDPGADELRGESGKAARRTERELRAPEFVEAPPRREPTSPRLAAIAKPRLVTLRDVKEADLPADEVVDVSGGAPAPRVGASAYETMSLEEVLGVHEADEGACAEVEEASAERTTLGDVGAVEFTVSGIKSAQVTVADLPDAGAGPDGSGSAGRGGFETRPLDASEVAKAGELTLAEQVASDARGAGGGDVEAQGARDADTQPAVRAVAVRAVVVRAVVGLAASGGVGEGAAELEQAASERTPSAFGVGELVVRGEGAGGKGRGRRGLWVVPLLLGVVGVGAWLVWGQRSGGTAGGVEPSAAAAPVVTEAGEPAAVATGEAAPHASGEAVPSELPVASSEPSVAPSAAASESQPVAAPRVVAAPKVQPAVVSKPQPAAAAKPHVQPVAAPKAQPAPATLKHPSLSEELGQ
ncbi:MAG: hypothetical protein KIT72_15395 [Polyangiaceae bacterium]|nr:hypothetical protein [Polyangiaceae bacterium]MCW5791800.1 hypothetical protein [Polyangiaceae bacterium]